MKKQSSNALMPDCSPPTLSLTPAGRRNRKSLRSLFDVDYTEELMRCSNVAVLNLYAAVRKFIAVPPVIFGHPLVLPAASGDYDDLFADELHPTAVTNAILANKIIQVVYQKWDDHIPHYGEAQLAKLAHISQ
jgi:hypothetical protein